MEFGESPEFGQLVGVCVPRNDFALLKAMGTNRIVPAGRDILAADDRSGVYLLEDGWACKYRLLPENRRKILYVHLPGEICNLDTIYSDRVQFRLQAITACKVVRVPREAVRAAMRKHERLNTLVPAMIVNENGAMIEQVTTLGCRTALERVGYLIHDLAVRLEAVGRVANSTFTLPMTQPDMADLLGMSTVHLNRMLKKMKRLGVIAYRGKQFGIPDRTALMRLSGTA